MPSCEPSSSEIASSPQAPASAMRKPPRISGTVAGISRSTHDPARAGAERAREFFVDRIEVGGGLLREQIEDDGDVEDHEADRARAPDAEPDQQERRGDQNRHGAGRHHDRVDDRAQIPRRAR